MLSPHDRIDALDALGMNPAWQQMVEEMRTRQASLVRAMVAEGVSAIEREGMATEYRMIDAFIEWPAVNRGLLEASAG